MPACPGTERGRGGAHGVVMAKPLPMAGNLWFRPEHACHVVPLFTGNPIATAFVSSDS